jgi:voltage-gated potassium channel
MPGTDLRSEYAPPRGEWVICGYGRCGKAIVRHLEQARVSATIIAPGAEDVVERRIVRGLGTEQPALQAAGIEHAEGLMASTDDDATNLAIAVAARALNPRLFVVLRQNRVENRVLFERFRTDVVMVSSEIIAHECLATLMTPLLPPFLAIVKQQPDAWADQLIARLQALIGDEVPVVWDIRVTSRGAPAVHQALERQSDSVQLGHLLRDSRDRERALAACPLMCMRAGESTVLPAEDVVVKVEDEWLFAGTAEGGDLQELVLRNAKALQYVREGRHTPVGWLWGRFLRN